MVSPLVILICSLCFLGPNVPLNSEEYSLASHRDSSPKVVQVQYWERSRVGFHGQQAFGIKLFQINELGMGKGVMHWEISGGTIPERRLVQRFDAIDLSGVWEIQEEDKSYRATLDREGNGTYNWQGGRIQTTFFSNGLWEGTWSQTENDREGGFEVLLSDDGSRAEGSWWYTRVGTRKNIPPGITGGSYNFIRMSPSTPSSPIDQ
ncbi:MAG: hypothetical protein O7F12_09835 [Nitrospirae bacterium]|nr:hypothetical protein [Nitrospirota bacterium]